MFGKQPMAEQVIKKMKPSDMASIKLSSVFFGILIATYFEKVATVDPMIYLFLMIIFAIKPLMLYLQK